MSSVLVSSPVPVHLAFVGALFLFCLCGAGGVLFGFPACMPHARRLADRDALGVPDQATDLVHANPDPDVSPDPRTVDPGAVRRAVRCADVRADPARV